MSYIRSYSNPEGLYIYGDSHGMVHICSEALSLPADVFNGILQMFTERTHGFDVEFKDARLRWNGERYELSYPDWDTTLKMHYSTMYYLAHTNMFRWKKP